MKRIAHYVDLIEDELDGAREYAETYVDCKSRGNTQRAMKYKEMANDELKHAMILHDFAAQDINELEKVFTPTDEMQETWDKSHRMYVEQEAWVKQMLSM